MNVSDAIRLMRAIRKFQDKPLPEEVILAILNAGRRSQSSKNEQGRNFIAMGIGSCIASIYEPERARAILGFPPEWHLRIALSFGYPADEEKLSAAPRKGGRRPLEEVVHWEKWQGDGRFTIGD